MVIAGTGHRPDKLGGWGDRESSYTRPIQVAKKHLILEGVKGVMSGGAAGWDLCLARAARELQLPLYMAVPFKGQESKWSRFWREEYYAAMDYAHLTHYVADTFSMKAFLDRNKFMVDYIKGKGGKILALWNGDTSGGTAHCVRYAQRQQVPIVNLWDDYAGVDLPTLLG